MKLWRQIFFLLFLALLSAAPAYAQLNPADIPPFTAAGASHTLGGVPDPGSTSHTPAYFLGDDAVWHAENWLTNFSVTSVPSIFTTSVANPTSTPALTVSYATGLGSLYYVVGTNGSGNVGLYQLTSSYLPTFVAAGASHSSGAVPDPGSSSHSTGPYYLGDDGNFHQVIAGSNVTLTWGSSGTGGLTIAASGGGGGSPQSQIWFGDGTDGAATISGNTTLTRDMYYSTLTVNSSITLSTAGYRIFCSTSATVNGTIDNSGANAATNGGNGTSGAGGAAGTQGTNPTAGTMAAGAAGNVGSAGAFNAVGNGRGGLGNTNIGGGISGQGGNGGADGNGNTGGTGTYTSTIAPIHSLQPWVNSYNTAKVASAGAGGGGGSSGGADASAGSGGGGAGGGGGGWVWLFAPTISLGSSGLIQANGGNASNAGTPYTVAGNAGGSGGGTGGGGGIVFMAYNSFTITSGGKVLANGGTKGTHSAGNGTGSAGIDGVNGSPGIILQYNFTTPGYEVKVSQSFPTMRFNSQPRRWALAA